MKLFAQRDKHTKKFISEVGHSLSPAAARVHAPCWTQESWTPGEAVPTATVRGRVPLASSDRLVVDVGEDEGVLLQVDAIVIGGHGPRRTRVRLRVGVVRLVADLGPSSTWKLTRVNRS